MATTNHERVGKALELLKAGFGPFVDREIQTAVRAQRIDAATLRRFVDDPLIGDKPATDWDVAALLKLMWETWNDVFRAVLGRAERNFVSELRDHRNNWAHQRPFSGDDAYRALDTTNRLLTAVSAPQAADVEKLKMELLRVRYDEQARGERRKQASLAIESAAVTLKPWRGVVTPHQDVGRVVLLALYERLDVDRRDQLHLMTELPELSAPVVRAPTGLHRYDASRLRRHEAQHLVAVQLLAERNRPVRKGAVQRFGHLLTDGGPR